MDSSLDPSQYATKIIFEGRAKIAVFESGPVPTKHMPVFYNPRMVINRNFTTLAVEAYQAELGRSVVACDAMAGSGFAPMRLLLEVKNVARNLC